MTRLALTAALVALAVASPARAGGKGKHAKPRPPAIDVAGAVASGDAGRQCDAAVALVGARQLAHASLLIGRCAGLADRADAARAARIAIARAAARDQWSTLDLDVVGADPATVTITIDAFADVPVAPGAWSLPAGSYGVVAHTPTGDVATTVTIDANSRSLIRLPAPLPPPHVVAGVVDFGDASAPLDAPIAGPPVVKHGSLLPKRFRAGLDSCGAMACRKAP